MYSHLTKWEACSLSLASYSCRTSILYPVITHSFIERVLNWGLVKEKGWLGRGYGKTNVLTFILVTRLSGVTESRQQHCQYLIQAKGKCSLVCLRRNVHLHFKRNGGKRLKFKYESFNGSDFLKTAFMVHYRFLGSFFLRGELYWRDKKLLALAVWKKIFFFFPKLQ